MSISKTDFACKCCGKNEVKQDIIDICGQIERESGCSLIINSGYRCEAHDADVKEISDSQHMHGKAADIHSGVFSVFLEIVIEITIEIGIFFTCIRRGILLDLVASTSQATEHYSNTVQSNLSFLAFFSIQSFTDNQNILNRGTFHC